MVIYRVDYEQKRINEQITVSKHTWKVKANATIVYIDLTIKSSQNRCRKYLYYFDENRL